MSLVQYNACGVQYDSDDGRSGNTPTAPGTLAAVAAGDAP